MSKFWGWISVFFAFPAAGAAATEPVQPVIEPVRSATLNYESRTALVESQRSVPRMYVKGGSDLVGSPGSSSLLHIDVNRPQNSTRVRLNRNATGSSSLVTSMGDARMTAKLKEIAQLSDGWYGPGSKAVDPMVLDVARQVIPRFGNSRTYVTLGPLSDGTLMLDWRQGGTECTAELHPSGRMTLTIDNADLDVYVEQTVDTSATELVDFFVATVTDDD